jgi:hypothetical protein
VKAADVQGAPKVDAAGGGCANGVIFQDGADISEFHEIVCVQDEIGRYA